jgi:hypothetical protein
MAQDIEQAIHFTLQEVYAVWAGLRSAGHVQVLVPIPYEIRCVPPSRDSVYAATFQSCWST